MQDDIFPAAEKILSDIENVLKKNPSLKSFEIIPAEDNENKSPVFHQEDSLGLASWCVQPLYCYAYRRLLELRQNKHRREEPTTVARWLLGALLLNPDVTTFWNMRRELVKSHKLDPSEELAVAQLALYHKPKCFEAFAYRRWLLSVILNAKEERYDPPPADSPLCIEIEIAGTCADRYANNYHAWSHRRHVMTLRESRGYTHPSLESEWINSLAWCQRHVSDYSGLSYRQFLLRKYAFESKGLSIDLSVSSGSQNYDYEAYGRELFAYVNSGLDETGDTHRMQKVMNTILAESKATSPRTDILTCFRALSYWVEECRVNESTISMYNDHEVLWYHRRFLAHLLMRLISSYKNHSCYTDELTDIRLVNKPVEQGDTVKKSTVDDCITVSHDCVMEAFRTRTEKIAELATKRDPHEKILVERFFKFLRSIGFENTS